MISRSIKYIISGLFFLCIIPLFAESIGVGSNPMRAVVYKEKIYVVNSDTNSVSVINTKTKEVTATIPVGLKPLSITVVGTSVYTGNSEGSTITVIDTQIDQVSETISVPKGLIHIFAVGNYIYAINNDTITLIDGVENTVVRATTTKGVAGSQFPTIYAAGNRVFIHHPNDVYMTALWSNGTMSFINIGFGSNSGAVVGKYYYAVNSYTGEVHVIAPGAPQTAILSEDKPIIIPVGKDPIQVLSLGTKIYINNAGDNTVSVIDSAKNTVIKTIPVGLKPLFMLFGERTLFVINNESNTISAIDTSTDTVIKTMSTGSTPVYGVVQNGTLYSLDSKSNSVSTFDIATPQLLNINTKEPAGKYTQNDIITIRASFDTNLAEGSAMKITLNTNKAILLNTIEGKTLSGTYTVSSTDNIAKLTVSSIDGVRVIGENEIPGVYYTLPAKKNIADFKTIVIEPAPLSSQAPNSCKAGGFYRICLLKTRPITITEYRNSLICEGIIGEDLLLRSTKSASRYDVLSMAVRMLRVPVLATGYSGAFGDVTPSMQPILEVALNRGLITDGPLFEPEKSVTRIEAYTMLMGGVCIKPNPTDGQNWIQAVHDTAYKLGMTNKTLSRFAPSSIVTKREVFRIASQLADWADITGGCQPKTNACSAK